MKAYVTSHSDANAVGGIGTGHADLSHAVPRGGMNLVEEFERGVERVAGWEVGSYTSP